MSKPVGTHEDGTQCWTKNCGRGRRQEAAKRLSYKERQALPEYANRFKQCRSCNRTQPLYEFSARQKNADGFDDTCRDCKKRYNFTYYVDNKEDLDSRSNERGALLKEINQAYITSYKEYHPCTDCGMKNILALDFDHRDNSNKKVNIGEVAHRFTLHRLKEEIDKCDVRCANCHRIKTYAKNSWRTGHVIETKHLGRVQRNNALGKMRHQEEMRKRMQNGCADCSNKDIRVLEFDHVRGEKIAHISDMVRDLVAWDVFNAELDKCDVRCANCHRIITRQRERTAI